MNILRVAFYAVIAFVGFQEQQANAMFGLGCQFHSPDSSPYLMECYRDFKAQSMEFDRQEHIARVADEHQLSHPEIQRLQKKVRMDHQSLVIPPFNNKVDSKIGKKSVNFQNNIVSSKIVPATNTQATVFCSRGKKNKENWIPSRKQSNRSHSTLAKQVMRNNLKQYR